MKKSILFLSTALLAISAFANEWQPLQVERVQQQAPVEQQPAAQYQAPVTPSYQAQQPYVNQYRNSVSAEYSVHKGKFANDIDADLKGFALGWSSLPYQSGMWGKFEYSENKDFDADYFEFSFGGHKSFYSAKNAYLIGTLGMGIGVLGADGFDDTLYFTVPVGLEAGFNFTPNLALYAGMGYKWAWDISFDEDRTLCNDGTWSDSVGRGTCSWHGGVAYPQPDSNTIGNYDGVTYKFGLRYSF